MPTTPTINACAPGRAITLSARSSLSPRCQHPLRWHPRTAQTAPGRTKPRQSIGALDSVPADFDPAANPILALHFFGIEPIRQTSDTADMAARLKRQRRIEHLHRLGPRAVGELLYEVAEGGDLDRALDSYERLTPSLLKALGGDRFPPAPLHEIPT